MKLLKSFFDRYPDTQLPMMFALLYLVCFYTFGQYFFSDTDSILLQLSKVFDQYGAILVFIGGFMETLFLVGIYLPAGLTILFSIVLDPTIPNILMVISLSILSAFSANVINFAIGKYGFMKFFNYLGARQILEAQSKKNNSSGAILMSCVSPNILGITVVYHAMKGMNFYKLMWLAFLSTLIWVPILSLIVLFIGKDVLKEASSLIFFYFFAAWIVYLMISQEVKYYLEKRSATEQVD